MDCVSMKKSTRCVIKCTSAFGLLILGFATTATGEINVTPPDQDVLLETISAKIPSYWSVEDLRASKPVDNGDSINPVVQWRFEADISPTEVLYLTAIDEPPLSVIAPSVQDEYVATLYGTAKGTYKAGIWKISLNLENDPAASRGKPESFFDGLVAIQGSQHETDLRRAQENSIVMASKERISAAIETANFERDANIAEISEMVSAELEAAKIRLQGEIDQEKERRDARLLDFEATLQEEQAKLTAAHVSELEKIKLELETEQNALSERLKSELALAALAEQADEAAKDRLEKENAMWASLNTSIEARAAQVSKLLSHVDTASDVELRSLVETISGEAPDWVTLEVVQMLGAKGPAGHAALKQLSTSVADPELRAQVITASAEFGVFKPIKQWADSVIAFSTQYDDKAWAAANVLGEPTVTVCGEQSGAWAPHLSANEWVKVAFAEKIIPQTIHIHESQKVGYVEAIILWNVDKSTTEIKVRDNTEDCPGVLDVQVESHSLPIEAITVRLNGRHGHTQYIYLDAIGISGIAVE